MTIKEKVKYFNESLKTQEIVLSEKRDIIEEKRKEFFNHFIDLAAESRDFGYPVPIYVNVKDGFNQLAKLKLEFAPYEKVDKIIVGYFMPNNDFSNPIYFNPEYEKDLRLNGFPMSPLACPDYLFLQLYEIKDEIYDKIENALIAEIAKMTSLSEMVIKMAKRL